MIQTVSDAFLKNVSLQEQKVDILRWCLTNSTKSFKMASLMISKLSTLCLIYLDVQEFQVDPVGQVGQVMLRLHQH